MKLSQPGVPAQLQTVFILKPEEVKKLAHRGETTDAFHFGFKRGSMKNIVMTNGNDL